MYTFTSQNPFFQPSTATTCWDIRPFLPDDATLFNLVYDRSSNKNHELHNVQGLPKVEPIRIPVRRISHRSLQQHDVSSIGKGQSFPIPTVLPSPKTPRRHPPPPEDPNAGAGWEE